MPETVSLGEMAVVVALEEKNRGVFESPPHSNRGARIDQYQEGRASFGQPWCLKFVDWSFAQAAARVHQKNPLPNLWAVGPFLEWAYREKRVVQGARRGDILVKRPARHVGLVLTAPENGTFSSVEGNTYTSDREKEGVYVVRRLKVENYLFVRL